MRTIEQQPKQGFRDFDLPVAHLLEERHHVTPRSFDTAEVARRRELRSGSLVLEQQARGIRIARTILAECEEGEGRVFFADMLAQAGVNTSWYIYAQGQTAVMRRRLHLPVMSDGRSAIPKLLLEDADSLLHLSENRSMQLRDANEYFLRSYTSRQRTCGRLIGNASLRLAVYGAVWSGTLHDYTGSDIDLQERVRMRCVKTLDGAREAHRVMGAHPSLASLADGDSHLAVFLRRNAPSQQARQVACEALAA